MIARAWHGAVPANKAAEYGRYVHETGVTDLRATEGNRGVYVLRRVENGVAHFLVISLWHSREDIRAFAGDDIKHARYYPDDENYLLELEPHATHYEVLVQPEPALAGTK